MKTFDLTAKELIVAKILVKTCLSNMGGSRPADLEYDEFTWVDAKDLMEHGYSRHMAAGFFSSLEEKGFLEDAGGDRSMVVSTNGWKFIDTVWDQLVKAEG